MKETGHKEIAMGDYECSAKVRASADALFNYLADISNLPRYIHQTTSANASGEHEIHVTANVEGHLIDEVAEFRVDRAARKLLWRAEGSKGHHGELSVSGHGNQSNVVLRLQITSLGAEARQIEEGIRQTLSNLARQFEEGAVRAA